MSDETKVLRFEVENPPEFVRTALAELLVLCMKAEVKGSLLYGSAMVPTAMPEAAVAEADEALAARKAKLFEVLDQRLDALPCLSKQAVKSLAMDDLHWLGQLVVMTQAELLRKPNVGYTSVRRLVRILQITSSSLPTSRPIFLGMSAQATMGWVPPDERVSKA
ncbi:MAG: hypothetical protein EBQ80_02180 [Proteobacteria bacterium]|nr:hypothetical protein [Pseudomonadota bacterium]